MGVAALIAALQGWRHGERHKSGHYGRIVTMLRWVEARVLIMSDLFTDLPDDARANYIAAHVLDACLRNAYLEAADGRPVPRLWRVAPVALQVSARGHEVLARAAAVDPVRRAA
jgi:hypothetical protein